MSARRQGATQAGNLLTAVAVVVAFMVSARAVQRVRTARALPPRSSVQIGAASWAQLTAAATPLRTETGGAGSPTVIEIGDYQCPFCARAAIALDSLATAHPLGTVAYIHLPLSAIHPRAYDAAVAAECANDQGRFREMHMLLFRRQAALDSALWRRWALEAGVADSAAFAACLAGSAARARVDRHALLAASLGVAGTPAYVVGGRLYPPGTPVDSVVRAARSARGRPVR